MSSYVILTKILTNQSRIAALKPLPIPITPTLIKHTTNNNNKNFSTGGSLALRPKNKKKCPFNTLGFSNVNNDDEPIRYSAVKKSFLSLALKHHPDNKDDDCTKMFLKIKNAFDQIRESNGIAILHEDDDDDEGKMSNDEYESWFHSETGKHANVGELNLSKETIKEVTDMISKSSEITGAGELDRSGGIWAMAKMISQDANDNVASIMGGVLKLEEGDTTKSSLKNRRRKRR